MEITSELLQTIEDRASEVGNIKFGSYPERVIVEGGSIILRYENYCCGSYEYEHEYISVEELTEDLDIIREKAKKEKEKRIEEDRLKREKIAQQEKERKEEQEKNTYLQLKAKYG
jgi:hypothetical protein